MIPIKGDVVIVDNRISAIRRGGTISAIDVFRSFRSDAGFQRGYIPRDVLQVVRRDILSHFAQDKCFGNDGKGFRAPDKRRPHELKHDDAEDGQDGQRDDDFQEGESSAVGQVTFHGMNPVSGFMKMVCVADPWDRAISVSAVSGASPSPTGIPRSLK